MLFKQIALIQDESLTYKMQYKKTILSEHVLLNNIIILSLILDFSLLVWTYGLIPLFIPLHPCPFSLFISLYVEQGDVGYPGASGPPGPQGPPVSNCAQSSLFTLCDLFSL